MTCAVLEAWHPHGRFRSRRRALALRIAPGSAGSIEMTVRSDIGADQVVENAFLILQVRSARRRWRVIARLRLRGRRGAPPETRVEAVDAHPAGV